MYICSDNICKQNIRPERCPPCMFKRARGASYWKRPPGQIVGTVCRGADTVVAQVKTSLLWSSSALSWCYTCEHQNEKKDGMTVILTKWKENMVHGSFGRSYDPHLLITRIWQERSEVYFLANSVTRFHCSAVKWYTSCLNLWLCLDFSGFHQNCPPRRFVTIELLIPAVQPTRTAFLTLRYQKSEESQYNTMSCWCNHTPFDCHNFGACFYLDMT